MRLLMVPILVATVCAGCGGLPWADANTGLACQRVAAPGDAVREGDPLAAGEPLAGLDVTSMSAAEVGGAAVAGGLAVTWRYWYEVGEAFEGGSQGYSECWCVPPPDGRVTQVLYDDTGALIVFVDSGQALGAARPQPHLGWGCGDASAQAVG